MPINDQLDVLKRIIDQYAPEYEHWRTTEDNSIKSVARNSLKFLRRHIEEQDAMIKAFKLEYPRQYKMCKEIARMKTEKRKCIDCASYQKCSKLIGVKEKSVECDWTPSRFKAKE